MTRRILNTHISEAEYAHLKAVAAEREDTLTNVVRSLIRADMHKVELDRRVIEQLDRWMDMHRAEAQASARLEVRAKNARGGGIR